MDGARGTTYLRTILNHFKWSNLAQGKKKIMRGLKSAILAIFQKLSNWLEWPRPVSAALKNCPQDLFSRLYFSFYSIFWMISWSAENTIPSNYRLNFLDLQGWKLQKKFDTIVCQFVYLDEWGSTIFEFSRK